MAEIGVWIEWGRGPIFRASLAFMLLGLARLAMITLWETFRIVFRAGDRTVPWRAVLRAGLGWLTFSSQLRHRAWYGLTNLVFHVGAIAVPLLLAGHIALWERGTGLALPAIPDMLADALTLTTLGCVLLLLVQRAWAIETRFLSRPQDYAIPVFVALPFLTGLLARHPSLNPVAFEPMFLAHVLSADLLMILVPLTKLSHIILLPGTQVVSEWAWHFPPDGGSRVGAALGKEEEPV